jgi:molybdopterin synthase sulfur carrier subunit
MTIDVKLFATLRMHLGVASVSLEVDSPPTVEALIKMVSEKVGEDIHDWLLEEDDELRMGTMILLEGHNIIHMNGIATKVETSQVAIFPPAGGG